MNLSPTLKRFIANASVMYANEAILSVAAILVTIKVVAYLGPERYGIYSTVLAFSYFFRLLTESSGVDDLIISDLAPNDRSRADVDAYITTGTFLRLALGFAAMCIAIAVAGALRYDHLTFGLIALFSLSMPFSFHKRKNPFIIRHVVEERRILPEALIFAVTALVLASKLAMVAAGAPLPAFVLADLALVVCLSGAFLATAFIRGDFTIHLGAFRWPLARDLFWRSLPVSVSGLFVMIFMRIDQVMLSKMVGMEAVGLYSVAVLLVEAPNVVMLVAGTLLLPTFSRLKGSERLPAFLSLCFRMSAWGGLMLVAAYSLFGEQILRLLWGNQYLASEGPLRALAWSAVFMWVGGLHGPILIATGLIRYAPYMVSFSAAMNVALNLALIPRYGAAGAAAATSMTYCLGFAFGWFLKPARFIFTSSWREILPLAVLVGVLTVRWPWFGAISPAVAVPVLLTATLLLAASCFRQFRAFTASPEPAK